MVPLYCAAPVILEDVELDTWQCRQFGDSRAGQLPFGALTLSSLGFIVSSCRGRQYQVMLVRHHRYISPQFQTAVRSIVDGSDIASLPRRSCSAVVSLLLASLALLSSLRGHA